MRWHRWHRWHPSLAVRLTITFGVGSLLVSAALAGSAFTFAWRYLVAQQQHTALHEAYVNAAVVRDGLRSANADVPSLLDSVTTATSSRSVVYQDGRWYSSSLLVGRDALPLGSRERVLAGTPVREWATVGGRRRLTIGLPLPAVNGAYFEVFDLDALTRTLGTLRVTLDLAALATTVVGSLLGWQVSRRLAAPVRTVADAAARIAAGRLDTRLPPGRDPQLASLSSSFNRMLDALQGRMERDARFAADVSHELRSPLTTLATSLSVLQVRRTELPDRAREAVDLLAAEVTRFERLVVDLLEIARVDAHAAGDPDELVRPAELVVHLTGRPEYAGVQLDVDAGCLDTVVRGDKRRLVQVLRNLLDNASTHGEGTVTVRLARAGPGAVQLQVEDHGPGVPDEFKDRVFERFARGPVATRRQRVPGTGLGLALVAEHVRAHDGRVWVEDAPHGGARFVVELPAVPA